MEASLNKVHELTKSKDLRNIAILVISIIAILAINSLLPLLEGSAGYTEVAQEMQYSEYEELHNSDKRYTLTHSSAKEIKEQEKDGLTTEITVKVYTKFFFQSVTWWTSTLINSISVVLIYYPFFNYFISKMKRKRKDYLDLKNEVNTAVQNQVDPVTFEPFNEQFNLERKIKQHIANVKYLKDLLIHKTSYKVRKAEGTKKNLKYKQRLEELDYQLTDEYINTYVRDKKVKYFKYIYPTFVTSGYNAIGVTSDAYSLIKSDSSKISKDGISKMSISIVLTIVLAVILTFTVSSSIDKPWYWVIVNILAKITPLILQVAFSYDYAESFMEEQLIPNLISRRNIILLYLAGVKNGEENK